MVAFIIIVGTALYWLFRETDYLRVRLPVGTIHNSPCSYAFTDTLQPKTNGILLLPEFCEFTRMQREFADTKYRDTWQYGTSYNTRRKSAYQIMTIGNNTVTLETTLYNLYDYIKQAERIQTEKPRKPIFHTIPLPAFTEQVRIGSHHEWVKWNQETEEYETISKYKKGYHHQVVNDYTICYYDCLCGKDWLKEHEHNQYPEPTLDISVDGGKSISVNGNYKRGMIKDFMAQYCRPGEGKIRLVKVR